MTEGERIGEEELTEESLRLLRGKQKGEAAREGQRSESQYVRLPVNCRTGDC